MRMKSSFLQRYAVDFNALSDGKDIGGNYFFSIFPSNIFHGIRAEFKSAVNFTGSSARLWKYSGRLTINLLFSAAEV